MPESTALQSESSALCWIHPAEERAVENSSGGGEKCDTENPYEDLAIQQEA